MKKILCAILSAVILLSALCFVSCDSEPELVDSINGMTAKEAATAALEKLKEKETYRVTVDAELFVVGLSIGSVKNFYENTTDGANMHYKFTDEDIAFVDTDQVLSMLKGYDKEVWYVDGVRYSINTAGEKVVDDSGNRQPSNVVEKMIDSITDAELDSALAYTKDGETYVLVTINIEEFNIGVVTCKIFLDKDGQLSSVILDGNLYTFGAVVTLNFEYGKVDKVNAPKDFKPNAGNNGNNGNGNKKN